MGPKEIMGSLVEHYKTNSRGIKDGQEGTCSYQRGMCCCRGLWV
jgi:hypothetical protein